MSNRLEHEFPALRWHRPVPRSVQHRELVRAAIAHGRRLHGTAIRRGARAVFAAAAQFVRCGAYGIAKQPPAQDCGRAAGSGP